MLLKILDFVYEIQLLYKFYLPTLVLRHILAKVQKQLKTSKSVSKHLGWTKNKSISFSDYRNAFTLKNLFKLFTL